MVLTASGGKKAGTEQGVSTVIGERYFLNFDVAGENLHCQLGSTSGGSDVVPDQDFMPEVDNEISFIATSTTTYVQFYKLRNRIASSFLSSYYKIALSLHRNIYLNIIRLLKKVVVSLFP